MDEQEVEESRAGLNISSATQKCHQLLSQCLSNRLLMEHEWAENRLADFNLWASGIGAAATETDKISLDARLSGKPALLTVFTRLLQMLIGFLEECLSLAVQLRTHELEQHLQWLARGHHDDQADRASRSRSPRKRASPNHHTSRSLSPWSDQSSLDSALDESGEGDNGRLAEAMLGIDSTMEQLNNLGFAIRRAGNHLRLQKADARFDHSDHSGLETFLKFWVLAHTRTRSPGVVDDPGTLSPIQLRLIKTNLIRRNRFLYAQRHSKRLLKTRQSPQVESLLSASTTGINESLPLYENEQPELLSRRKDLPAAGELSGLLRGTLADNSTATRLESATEILKQKTQGRDSQITATALRVRYPNPPKIRAGAKLFKCPSCCHTLDIDFSIGGRWRRHLTEDICPYACIYPDCPKPEATFVTRRAWMSHMMGEDHSTGTFWSCLICADGVRFEARTLLFDHIAEKHEQHVSSDQIPTLLDACLQTMPTTDFSCPLCSKDETEETRSSLDHIAEHIHSFALFSLPWAPDAPVVNPGALQEASTKVIQWLGSKENCPMPNDAAAQTGLNSTTDEASLYFTNETYFAENESVRSSSSSASTDTERDLEGFDTEGPLVFPETEIAEPEDLLEEVKSGNGPLDGMVRKINQLTTRFEAVPLAPGDSMTTDQREGDESSYAVSTSTAAAGQPKMLAIRTANIDLKESEKLMPSSPKKPPAEALSTPRPGPPPYRPHYIAVIGETGVRKSTFIRDITGNNDVVIDTDLESCTQDVKEYEATIDGRVVKFIDTPGFNDSRRTDSEILEVIGMYLREADLNGVYLTAVIYLQWIHETRIRGSAIKNLRILKLLCGKEYYGNIVLVTGGWSDPVKEIQVNHEIQLRTQDRFWREFIKIGATFQRHTSGRESALKIVRHALDKTPSVLQFQRELAKVGIIGKTKAGEQLILELAKERDDDKGMIDKLGVQLKNSEQRNKVLEAQIDDLKKGVASMAIQIENLQTRLEDRIGHDDHLLLPAEDALRGSRLLPRCSVQ